MSDRLQAGPETRLRALLQEILDRLYHLENGGTTRGLVSFGSVVQIGDIEISIVPTSPTARKVVFTNMLNNATYTITL